MPPSERVRVSSVVLGGFIRPCDFVLWRIAANVRRRVGRRCTTVGVEGPLAACPSSAEMHAVVEMWVNGELKLNRYQGNVRNAVFDVAQTTRFCCALAF